MTRIHAESVHKKVINKITQREPIKVDAEYISLLRRFRAHFRAKFDTRHNPNCYQHWSKCKYTKNVRCYMVNVLNLPSVFLDQDSILKMITLLFPCSTKKDFKFEETEDRIIFLKAFKENSHGMRIKFFSNPLMKHMWSKIFITE